MENLETKLKRVLDGLSNKLQEQEVSFDEFDRYVFELMSGEKIFNGTYSKNKYNIGYYHSILLDKIKAVEKAGIRATYVGLIGHFSKQSLIDIEEHETLISNARRHLKATFGEENIFDSQFHSELMSFVSTYIKNEDISQCRREYLSGYLFSFLYSEFKIILGLPHQICEYERIVIN